MMELQGGKRENRGKSQKETKSWSHPWLNSTCFVEGLDDLFWKFSTLGMCGNKGEQQGSVRIKRSRGGIEEALDNTQTGESKNQ